ncbi:hypothetical protein MRX96_030860 [Rhipicephalus microplus]
MRIALYNAASRALGLSWIAGSASDEAAHRGGTAGHACPQLYFELTLRGVSIQERRETAAQRPCCPECSAGVRRLARSMGQRVRMDSV